ncbi:MAG: hypothetical protein AMXMBFR13_48090 [Phycisphaerae bacterium]
MRRSDCRRSGLTLAEVAVSLVILGVAMTAGVQSLGSFAVGARTWQERSTGMELANRLMAEINTLPFKESGGANTIGREAGENDDDRSTFDDVDDYDDWDVSPPRDTANTQMTGYDGYRQRVTVVFDESLGEEFGVTLTAGLVKKITVTVLKDGKELARLVTYRTDQQGNLP